MQHLLPKILLSSMVVLGSIVLGVAHAAQSTVTIEAPEMNPNDKMSLQRGAKYFMNYCSGCHSLEYMRFSRLAKDIGITDAQGNILEEVMKKDLMFNTDKVGNTLSVAMDKNDAKEWFGVAPPDLTLETRLRGVDWVYGFLTTFFVDPNAPWGVNNLVYPGTAMPNILGALQGDQQPIYQTETVEMEGGSIQQQLVIGVKPAKNGLLSPQEFDQMVYDIVNFLSYTADPGKIERQQLGVFVLLFLVIFTLFAYLLKREYWKDVH